MIKDKVKSLKKGYDKVKKSKKEFSLKEMKEIVKFKNELRSTIQLLNDIIFAINEAEEFGRTFSTARARIKKEIKNLEVLLETF